MSMTNKANRTCADVDIRELSTMKPFLFFETANTTGLELSSDDTYATAKGAKRISFSNPIDGTFTIEAQIMPIELYAMLSDGTIDTTAVVAEKATVTATTAGTLTVPTNIKAGTLFVYTSGDYAGTEIEGSLTGTTFTATTANEIEEGVSYDIGYLVTKSEGVKKVSFNDSKNPKDYFITMLTNDKDEEGIATAKKITIYKAKPQKSLSLSYSSDSDPVSVTITCTALTDKEGNQVDIIELED